MMSTASGCDDCDDRLIMKVDFLSGKFERGFNVYCDFGRFKMGEIS